MTNTVQFGTLSSSEYLDGCDFQLKGIITLVDTNRDLVVLQDETGAVSLNFRPIRNELRFGQQVTMDGTNCVPTFARFPNFPFNPSGHQLRNSFEAPSNCGDYYLARMSGYLQPPTTGEYSFWIASDNSSELWLSTDQKPSNARRIAYIPRFNWVAPHEWSRFPSQHSQSIWLEAGKTYYIEALHEQTTVGDHLAVAWQGPGLEQSIIEGRYLTPFGVDAKHSPTNGILREFWTNYLSGDLADLGGARPFRSALSVENVAVHVVEPRQWPNPKAIVLSQPWSAEENFRWVTAEGSVRFIGSMPNAVWLELAGDQMQVQVRAPSLGNALLQKLRNARVRVEGVCEGVYDKNDNLVPGIIWVSRQNDIHVVDSASTNVEATATEYSERTSIPGTSTTMQGFYSTRGVVTFNDRVLNTDYLIVQENESAMLVSGGETQLYQNKLQVGEWVELGGALQPGKYIPTISPLVITELGWHALPPPTTERLGSAPPTNHRGKWSELEGVVHAVNANGTVSVIGRDGLIYFWIGETSASELKRYVDAKLSARGVLLLGALDAPLLLIPSRNFINPEEPAPEDPFTTVKRSIAEAVPETTEFLSSHRVHVAGEVTYRDAESFFIQDASGGIRVQTPAKPAVEVGDTVEVLAFPSANGAIRTLSQAIVRPDKARARLLPRNLDISEALSSKQNGALVLADAIVLARKTNAISQVLELQEQQRVFAATLLDSEGSLPEITPGSRVKVIGVCESETIAAPIAGEKPTRVQFLASLNILLRGPTDVTVLRGPPWWTWKRAALLVGSLLAGILGTLLWVHFLRRRLERQQAAQLAFSRQVLERLEDERRRIAANLHDGLGQVLLVIRNRALLAMQRSPDENGVRQRFEEISDATSQALEEVRQITHGLRPYQLNRLGLTQAIRATLTGASSDRRILFANRVEDVDHVFDEDAEIHVYRIVQEAISNIIKHSAATEAAVVIKKRTNVISLSIRDNGKGFNANSASAPAPNAFGFGLGGIAERVRILGGALTIDSRPGSGTNLTVEIPTPIRKDETGNNNTDRG